MSKVLIVEDDKSILLSLSIRLRAEGYEVTTAQDAMMGMSAAVREQPDLVLLDISMPAGNGFDVARRFQDNARVVGTPIIFLTASRQPGLRAQAEELGAVAFFEKPYDPEQLMSVVNHTLGRTPSAPLPAPAPEVAHDPTRTTPGR